MNELDSELRAGGALDVQFVLLSDTNADYFVGDTTVPIFEDSASGQPTWDEMAEGARKHDTFIYRPDGTRAYFWDTSCNSFGNWKDDIRAQIEAIGS